MNRRFTLVLVVVLALLSGCAYTNVRRPLDSNFDRTDLGLKEGKASSYSVLWLVAWGDAGTKAAAKDGGLTVIKHADTETLSILLGLYVRQTTVVYGD